MINCCYAHTSALPLHKSLVFVFNLRVAEAESLRCQHFVSGHFPWHLPQRSGPCGCGGCGGGCTVIRCESPRQVASPVKTVRPPKTSKSDPRASLFGTGPPRSMHHSGMAVPSSQMSSCCSGNCTQLSTEQWLHSPACRDCSIFLPQSEQVRLASARHLPPGPPKAWAQGVQMAESHNHCPGGR